ncbi:MAG: hypothetical protein KDA37_17500 [Planctomycetales bacterium]|nr:hypothetical protein [Planctomycetales bacterium]
MAQSVAIEFDRAGVRAAVVEGGALVRAARIEAPESESAAAIAAALRTALPEVRWSRAEVVGVVAGDQLRCRLLKLPPAPDADLPDMVRMQAGREFAASDDLGVVDYVPLSGDEATQRLVLVAALSNDDLHLLKQLAGELDTSLERVTPRGLGSASLAMRVDPSLAAGSRMVIAAAEESADLVVLQAGKPSLIRTARVRPDDELAAMRSEARRTSAMASQQTGERVESQCFIGYAELPTQTASVGLSLAPLLTSRGKLSGAEVDAAGRLSGVIGAALDLHEEAAAAIDFLHPHQPTKDNTQQRRLVLLAAAAAASVLLGIGWCYLRLWSLDNEVAEKQDAIRQQQLKVEQLQPTRERAEAVAQWLATDVDWLDEIERLGRKLRPVPLDQEPYPADSDVFLRALDATPNTARNSRGGRIDITTASKTPYSYDEIEQGLRDEDHSVETSVSSLSTSGDQYRWEAKTTLRVENSRAEGSP